MSKLKQVVVALRKNLVITIVGTTEKRYLPEKKITWDQTIDFHVAPKTGVYSVEKLQSLMMSLVPGLKPTDEKVFLNGCYSEIVFGRLCFEEDLDTEVMRQEIVLTGDSIFSIDGFVNGEQEVSHVEKGIHRQIRVRLFPNLQVAKLSLVGKYECEISKQELEQYRRDEADTLSH